MRIGTARLWGWTIRGFAGAAGRRGAGFAAWGAGALRFSAELQPVSAKTSAAGATLSLVNRVLPVT